MDDKLLLHAANVAAELLDNDEDGVCDDMDVCDQLASVEAFMPIFIDEDSDASIDFEDNGNGKRARNGHRILFKFFLC